MMLESPCIPAVTARAPQTLSSMAPVSPTSRVFHWSSSNSSSGLLYPSSSKNRSFSMLQVVPGSRSTASVQSCSSSSKASSVTEELSSCILPHIAPLDKKSASHKDVDRPLSQESPWSLLGTTPVYDEFFEWAVKDTSERVLAGVSCREPSQKMVSNVPCDSNTRRLISSSPSNDKSTKKKLSTQLLKGAPQECHNRVSFCLSQPLKCEENGGTGQLFGRHSGETSSIDRRNTVESQSSSERSALSFVAHDNKTNALSPMPVETRKLKPMKLQFFRTKMCPWVVSIGHCRKGSSCRYAHTLGELRPLPDLSKTKLCPKLIETGSCERYKDCKYAHSQDELRATQSFSKTKLCPLWLEGQCLAGSLCRFAHGEKELRPIVDATRKGSVKDAGGNTGDAVGRYSSRKGCDTTVKAQNTDSVLGDQDGFSLLENSLCTDENESSSVMSNLCSSQTTRVNSDVWRERTDKVPKSLQETQCNSFNNVGRTALFSEVKSPCFGQVTGISGPACGQTSSTKDGGVKAQEKETFETCQLFKKGHRELVGRDDLTTTSTSAESHTNFSLETGLPFEESLNSYDNGNVFETQTTLDGACIARDLTYREYAARSDVAHTECSVFLRKEEEKNSLRRSSLASWPLRLRRFSCQDRHSVCPSASAVGRYHSLTKSLFPLDPRARDANCQQGTVSTMTEATKVPKDGKAPATLYSASQSWSSSSTKPFAVLPYLSLSSHCENEGCDQRYSQSSVLPSVDVSRPSPRMRDSHSCTASHHTVCEKIQSSQDLYIGGPSRCSPTQTRSLLADEFDLPFSSSGANCVPIPSTVYGNTLRNDASIQQAPFGWVSPEPFSKPVGLDFKRKSRQLCNSPDLSPYTPYWTQKIVTAAQWDQETSSREHNVQKGVNPSTSGGFMAPTHFLPPGMFSPVPQRTTTTLPPRASSVLHISFPNGATKRELSFRCQGLDSAGSKGDGHQLKVVTEDVRELSSSSRADECIDTKTTLICEGSSRFEDANGAKEKSPLGLQSHYGPNVTCEDQQKNQVFLITPNVLGAQRKPAEPMDSLSPLVRQTTSDANLSRRYTIPFETVSAHESGFFLGHNGVSLSCGGSFLHSTPTTQRSPYAYKPPLVAAKQRMSVQSILGTDKTQAKEVLSVASQVVGSSASGNSDLQVLCRHAPDESWDLVTPKGLDHGPADNTWLKQKSKLLDASCLDFRTGATADEGIAKQTATSTRDVFVEDPGVDQTTNMCASIQNRSTPQVMQPMCVASPLKSSAVGYAAATKSSAAIVPLVPSTHSHSSNGDSMFPEFPFFSSFKGIGSSSDATPALSDVEYCTSLAASRSFTAPMQQFRGQKLSRSVDHQEVAVAFQSSIASKATKATSGGFARSRTVDVSGTSASLAQTSP